MPVTITFHGKTSDVDYFFSMIESRKFFCLKPKELKIRASRLKTKIKNTKSSYLFVSVTLNGIAFNRDESHGYLKFNDSKLKLPRRFDSVSDPFKLRKNSGAGISVKFDDPRAMKRFRK